MPAADQDRRAIEEQAIDQVGGAGKRRRCARRLRRAGGRRRSSDAIVDRTCDHAPSPGGAVGGRASARTPARRRDPPAPAAARRALGASASSVPRPTRIASCRARSRCACARASAPGDPPALAVGQRDAAVERGGELERDVRPAQRPPGQEPRHRRARLGRARRRSSTAIPAVAQPREPRAVGARIGIAQRRRPPAPRPPRSAGRRRPGPRGDAMRAGLERDIGGGAARRLARLRQRHRLGMRAPARLGPAAPDDAAVLHDHAADIGIGRRPSPRPLGERQRGAHPAASSGRAQSPQRFSLSSSRRKPARRSSSCRFCSASSFWRIGSSIFCCAMISASVRFGRPLLDIDDVGPVDRLGIAVVREGEDQEAGDRHRQHQEAQFIRLALRQEEAEVAIARTGEKRLKNPMRAM